uniref:Mos1 transposase HTH domain-containing protein n=1 Tax=Tetranychus urticae TaxID=32264 RepID=A0A158P5I0_TETUR
MDYQEILTESVSDEEQRVFLKFCAIEGCSNSVAHSNLVKKVGNKALSRHTVDYWMSKFRSGVTSCKDSRGGDHQDEARKAERIEKIQAELATTKTGIPETTVKRILKNDLKLKKLLGRWVPHELTEVNMEHRVLACKENLRIHKKTPTIIQRTVSIDETWVSLYMEPDKNQMREWRRSDEPPSKAPKQNIHGEKRMLIMAMDFTGIAFWELLPEKTTVTGEVYRKFLGKHLPNWLGTRNSQHLWLLHDNARPHKHKDVKELLAEKGISVWNHPPYSPDISPLDYGCFAQLKRELRGIKHTGWHEFERALKAAVKKLNDSGSMNAISKLPKRWQAVVDSEGQYI